ncbi:efflux RND transporter periplasmic adaptor subunit [Janthinobacterium sp.]|uniref:efflux RND transporter periplasmic adaptor subunit n=1 Tax=Janthinobacterium sp. TaxID=1871054 RepID=UPI00293D6C68|nr:efflux RND transporter periplasmic adaptor subunit [Janthinobacterium sp.]
MNKKLLGLAAVALAAGLGLAWYLAQRPPAEAGLVLYGNVDLRQVSLAFNGSERIVRLAAREGERVRAGQVLGELDPAALTLEVAQAQAQWAVREQVLRRLRNGARPEELEQARAALRSARAEEENAGQQLRRLRGANAEAGGFAVSAQDVDGAATRLRVAAAAADGARQTLALRVAGPRREELAEAQAQLDAGAAQLALLRHRLGQLVLKSPVDGVVRSRLLEPGDMASPQKPVYALAINDPKWVRAYVRESELGLLKPGMAARVSSDSHPEAPVAGRLGYISSVAEFTPKTVQTEDLRTSLVYEVRVEVDDPRDQLRLGMPATVRFAAGAPR